MTTAHRATWVTAKGSEEQGGTRYFVPSQQRSVKDAPGYLTLKTRTSDQASAEALRRRDLKAELFARELSYLEEKKQKDIEAGVVAPDYALLVPTSGRPSKRDAHPENNLALEGSEPPEKVRRLETHADDVDSDEDEDDAAAAGGGGAAVARASLPASTANANDDDDDDDDDDGDDDSDDDDEDETAALLAELERIKKERAAEAAKREADERAAAEAQAEASMIGGNPLLQGEGDASFAIGRRWDDDVVFRNQARDVPQHGKRFINDTTRNDFHRRFLAKYIQ